MRLIIFIVICCCVACSSNNEKKENINRDTLAKVDTSVNSVEKKIDSLVEVPVCIKKPDKNSTVNERLRILRDAYLINYNEIKNTVNDFHILDRFENEKNYKLFLEKKFPVKYGEVNNVMPIAQIRLYEYNDSAQCANAVNNWYNCFGKNCDQIQKGINTTIKSTPGYYIIQEKYILCLEYKLEFSENNWNEMIKNIDNLFRTKKATIIQIKPHGKLIWL